MVVVLVQMAALIVCGVVWRLLSPGGLDGDSTRRVLTQLVYYLLLPALVLMVLWRTPLGLDSLRIAMVAAFGVLAALLLSWLTARGSHMPRATAGALMLAAAFPNVTYLGLPVLEQTLGPWARSVAIQYDLFACTPLLLTVGILVARAHGEGGAGHPLRSLVRVPPLWAAVAAVMLNLAGVPMPEPVHAFLFMLATGVVPLMLISLGMSLRWQTGQWSRLPYLLPVIVIQLIVTPLLVWGLASISGLTGKVLVATVLEAAMPSMVLGVVLCDRYRLDTPLYAMAVTVTTLLSLLSLPFWFEMLQ